MGVLNTSYYTKHSPKLSQAMQNQLSNFGEPSKTYASAKRTKAKFIDFIIFSIN